MERKQARKQRQLTKTTEKKQSKKTVAVKSKKTEKKQQKQVSIFTVLVIVLVIAAFVGIYFGIRYIVITLKYKQYTDKMNLYGYNELYNNGKANAVQQVTNIEAIKVVIGSLTNSKDIYNIYYLASKDVSENVNWYNYATYLGVQGNIAKSQLDENATKIDAVMLATKIIDGNSKSEIEEAKLEISESKLKEYTEKEKEIISKAITLGLIQNTAADLSKDKILKGELNKIVTTLVEKYATVYYKNTNVNQNEQVKIITQKDSLPSNAKDYPYIVDNITKEEYEQDFKVASEEHFETPKEIYKHLGYLYGQTDYMLQAYFNGILNVDYKTITNKNFIKNIKNQVVYSIAEKDVEEYVKYVKENKIKLEGSATPLLPIIYNTGEDLVIRTKLTFKILNSDTQYNLLFGDESNKIKYTGEQITIYVDVPVGMTVNSNSMLVYINCLAKNISKPTTSVVIEE